MSENMKFAALLCSRLCHDLVNPVGAFSNGLEILGEEDDPDMRRQVIDLLSHSAYQTAQRLQFFRLAFGAAGGFGETVAATVARDAAAAYFSGGKTMFDWGDNVGELSRDGLKILLNLILVGGECLLRGGRIAVGSGRNGGGLEMRVTAEGERLMFKPETAAALNAATPVDQLDPKTAPAYLAAVTARDLGGELTFDQLDERALQLAARLP